MSVSVSNPTLKEIQENIKNQLHSSSWFHFPDRGYMNNLTHAVIGLNEEAGEVAGLLKKQVFRGKERTNEQWVDELGDVLWYLTAVCIFKGVTLEEVWQHNVEKLQARRKSGVKGNESWEG